MKENHGTTTAKPKSVSDKSPENKKSRKARVETEDEESDEEPEEPVKTPKAKKTVRLEPPPDHKSDDRSRRPLRRDLPFVSVPAMKPAIQNWAKRNPMPLGAISNAKTDKTVAYRTRAPVQQEGGDREMVTKIMDSEVTVTTRAPVVATMMYHVWTTVYFTDASEPIVTCLTAVYVIF